MRWNAHWNKHLYLEGQGGSQGGLFEGVMEGTTWQVDFQPEWVDRFEVVFVFTFHIWDCKSFKSLCFGTQGHTHVFVGYHIYHSDV